MGIFLNRGNEEFDSVVHSQIYIDKTDILKLKQMNSRQKLERRKEKGEDHRTLVRTPGCGKF